MAQRSLRFCVRDAARRRRAASWKLWTETAQGKADVYLTCRALGGFLKASLHESGNWHCAFSKKAFEELVEGAIPTLNSRFIERWAKPPDLGPGVTLALRIVTPWSAATMPIAEGDASGTRNLIWVPNAPENNATEIDIFLVAPTTRVTGWPGKRSMNTSLIGAIPLNSGTTAWVVHWVIDIPDFSRMPRGPGRFFKGKSREDLRGEGLHALVFGTEQDGSRVLYDCAVQQLPYGDSGAA